MDGGRAANGIWPDPLTGEMCRRRFAALGLAYGDEPTPEGGRRVMADEMEELKALLAVECRMHAARHRGSGLRMASAWVLEAERDLSLRSCFLFCRVKWDDGGRREAVSFNQDGFIGFAGWASTENAQPFYRGFMRWLEFLMQLEAEEKKAPRLREQGGAPDPRKDLMTWK